MAPTKPHRTSKQGARERAERAGIPRRPKVDSSAQFPLAGDGVTRRIPGEVKNFSDNYAPNSVDTAALDTRPGLEAVTRSAIRPSAVGRAEIGAGEFDGAHFPMALTGFRRLPGGVRFYSDNVGEGAINDASFFPLTPDGRQLPGGLRVPDANIVSLSTGKLAGVIALGNIPGIPNSKLNDDSVDRRVIDLPDLFITLDARYQQRTA